MNQSQAIKIKSDAKIIDLLMGKPDVPRLTTANYVFLRYATQPIEYLLKMQPVKTLQAIECALHAEGIMENNRQSIVDGLFQLCATIESDDTLFRRNVLQLKREVHQSKSTKLSPEVIQKIVISFSDKALQEKLLTWLRAKEHHGNAIKQGESIFLEELQQTRRAMRLVLESELFRNALAIAAKGVARHAKKESKLPEKISADNYERSLLGYLIRASTKTSPFASFMSTLPMTLSRNNVQKAHLQTPRHENRIRLNRGLVYYLYKSLYQLLPEEQRFHIVNNTLLHIEKNRHRALSDRDMVLIGRPWRQQNLSHFQLHPKVSEVLMSKPNEDTFSGWKSRLAKQDISDEQANTVLNQLVDRNILRIPPLFDGFNDKPEQLLIDFINKMRFEREGGLKKLILNYLNDFERSNPDENADKLALIIENINHQSIERNLRNLKNIVVQDCWTTNCAIEISQKNLSQLSDLQRFLSTQIGISPHFQILRERFIHRFGAGGRCDDVLSFLIEHGSELISSVEYGDKPEAYRVVKAPNGAKLALTAQIQIVMENNKPKIVINKVFEGAGWLAARNAFGQDEQMLQLRQQMTQWLNVVADNKEPVDMLINGDCNDLQAHPKLTKRVLSWPGEANLVSIEDQLDISQLVLQHDIETGMINIFDNRNTPIHLTYLGGTIQSPSWGIPYSLSLISQPYILMRPEHAPDSTLVNSVQYQPRTLHGDIILKRACWWLPVDDLKKYWFQSKGAKRLLDVKRYCQQHKIPTVFFARLDIEETRTTANSTIGNDRKPLWVDTNNPFCLDLLENFCAKVTRVSFIEALPNMTQQWLTIDGKEHTSELQVELIIES